MTNNKHNDGDLSATFAKQGFVGPLPILSIKEARQALDDYQEWRRSENHDNNEGDSSPRGNQRFKPHLYLAFAHRIAHHPRLIDAVTQVLQTDNILLWSSDFNIKAARTTSHFPPHQDGTYAGLQPASKCVTAWVALSNPVGIREGCLSFWPASHLSGILPHVESADDPHNMLSRGQYIQSYSDTCERHGGIKMDPIPVSLHAGEASIHSFLSVHHSGPNNSDEPRIGLALRYIAAEVEQVGAVRETVTLVKGQPVHTGFELEPLLPFGRNPTLAEVGRGKEAHAEAMRRESANYFQGSEEMGYDQCLDPGSEA